MAERVFDDPSLPPPGSRSGAGTASIVPYLLKTLATRPQAAASDALPRRSPPLPALNAPPPTGSRATGAPEST